MAFWMDSVMTMFDPPGCEWIGTDLEYRTGRDIRPADGRKNDLIPITIHHKSKDSSTLFKILTINWQDDTEGENPSTGAGISGLPHGGIPSGKKSIEQRSGSPNKKRRRKTGVRRETRQTDADGIVRSFHGRGGKSRGKGVSGAGKAFSATGESRRRNEQQALRRKSSIGFPVSRKNAKKIRKPFEGLPEEYRKR